MAAAPLAAGAPAGVRPEPPWQRPRRHTCGGLETDGTPSLGVTIGAVPKLLERDEVLAQLQAAAPIVLAPRGLPAA